MSIIERAAKRLEELKRAGVEIPDHNAPGGALPSSPPAAAQAPSADLRAPAPAAARAPSPAAAPIAAPVHSPASRGEPERLFTLDLARLAANGFVTPDIPRSRIADEFRIIKRPLLANASDKKGRTVRHGNLIMVTSAVPGEGKTFSAINLALSMAMELNRTVLLVDADVARPSLPRQLGIPHDSLGLLDVLDKQGTDLSDVLLRTNVDNLSILPSGTPHTRATELLASDAMTQFLEEISARYQDRIVVFDSPPLLVTTEARVLATQMGQIVFVVHAESTLQSEVKRALATIESCPLKMVVLNQARTAAQGAYGYGYGYGYGA